MRLEHPEGETEDDPEGSNFVNNRRSCSWYQNKGGRAGSGLRWG